MPARTLCPNRPSPALHSRARRASQRFHPQQHPGLFFLFSPPFGSSKSNRASHDARFYLHSGALPCRPPGRLRLWRAQTPRNRKRLPRWVLFSAGDEGGVSLKGGHAPRHSIRVCGRSLDGEDDFTRRMVSGNALAGRMLRLRYDSRGPVRISRLDNGKVKFRLAASSSSAILQYFSHHHPSVVILIFSLFDNPLASGESRTLFPLAFHAVSKIKTIYHFIPIILASH